MKIKLEKSEDNCLVKFSLKHLLIQNFMFVILSFLKLHYYHSSYNTLAHTIQQNLKSRVFHRLFFFKVKRLLNSIKKYAYVVTVKK